MLGCATVIASKLAPMGNGGELGSSAHPQTNVGASLLAIAVVSLYQCWLYCRHREQARSHRGSSVGRRLAFHRRFNRGNVDLGHCHHGLESAFGGCFIGAGDRINQDPRGYLP